jgi:hypothetical protein
LLREHSGNPSAMVKGDVRVVPGEEGGRIEIAARGGARFVYGTQREADEADIACDGRIRERATCGEHPCRLAG